MDRPDAIDDARRILGVPAGADLTSIQAAFRRQLRLTHPDLNDADDATERTVRLTEAYRLLVRVGGTPSAPPPTDRPAADRGPAEPGAHEARSTGADDRRTVAVALVDGETIGFAAPADETMFLLLDAAHRLGEISYLDRSAGLLEVVVEFLDAPTSSVVLALQGRATGVTEVSCSVEPLSGGSAPPADAVTRLLLDTLVAEPHLGRSR